MKAILKSLLVIAVLFTYSTGYARVDSNYAASKSAVESIKNLPSDVTDFLGTYFHHEDVTTVNVTNNGYSVVLSDGSIINFNQYGQWNSVESPKGQPLSIKVLKGLLPKKVVDYLSESQKQKQVTTIKFDFDKGFSINCGECNPLNFTKTGRLN